MLADWLQGPYLYRLYEDYGFLHEQIAAFYMVGYGTAMLAGPLMGGLADRHGRKKMSMVFCGIYALCCLCKLSSSFLFLVLGRFFSGIATALLTSTFESWMLAEHDRMGFPSDWLPRIFGLATFGNGVVAVLAGVLAHVAADSGGHHPSRPFMLAVVVLGITAATINNTWDENRPPEDELLVSGPAVADRLGSALRLVNMHVGPPTRIYARRDWWEAPLPASSLLQCSVQRHNLSATTAVPSRGGRLAAPNLTCSTVDAHALSKGQSCGTEKFGCLEWCRHCLKVQCTHLSSCGRPVLMQQSNGRMISTTLRLASCLALLCLP